jgi:PEP-CTERM motif
MLCVVRPLAFVALAFSLAAVPAKADTVYSITDTVDTEIDQADAHAEQAWNFTTQPGWCASCTVESVTVTETFSLIIPGGTPSAPNFQSTFIHDTTPLSTQTAIFTIFAAQAPTATETTTLTPGVGGFTIADISSGGALGEFATRVARNGGGFFLDTMTISIDVTTPEPASFALLGLGLIGLFTARWKRSAKNAAV